METILVYILLGVVAGILAGLLGVGGGLVIVPALALILPPLGIHEGVVMHVAIGTSLATIVVTSVSSVRAHQRRGAVLWPVFGMLAPGLVGGVLLGAVLADLVPTYGLSVVVGLFALTMAAQMAFGRQPRPNRVLPGRVGSTAVSGGIGLLSAFVGIGGGSLTVPFLVWSNIDIRKAVATSAACGFPIALAGAIGFAITGYGDPRLPEWSTGYIYWPAFLSIAVASLLFAPVGAKMAHTLPTGVLKKVFAAVLAVIGLRMLFG